jgi:hypothetical protein|nr:toll/interleukin-1 receptor domain-containing protein [uncultured Lachnoanaerobaculum sp.]
MEKNYIYISSSSADSKKIRPVIKKLEKDGFKVVLSTDAECKKGIKMSGLIKKCDLFLAFISSNYVKDEECLDQLHYARNKTVEENRLLIYIDEVDLPDSFEMRYGRFQAIYMCKYKKIGDFFQKLYSTEKLKKMVSLQKNPVEEPASIKKKRAIVTLLLIIGVVFVLLCTYLVMRGNNDKTTSGRVSLENDIYISGVYDHNLNSIDVTIEVPEKNMTEEFIAMYTFVTYLQIFDGYEVTFKSPSSMVTFSDSDTSLTNFMKYPEPYVEYSKNIFEDITTSSYMESVIKWRERYDDYFASLGINKKILQAGCGDTYNFSEGDSDFSLSILYDKEGYVLEIYFIGKFINESDFISALSACSVEMSEWKNIGDKFIITFFLVDENIETIKWKWTGYYSGKSDQAFPLITDSDDNVLSLTEEQSELLKKGCLSYEQMKYTQDILRDVEKYLKNLRFREE